MQKPLTAFVCAIVLTGVAAIGWWVGRKTNTNERSDDVWYETGPTDQGLQKRFAATELPAYVRLKLFEVQASDNIGNKIEPMFRARFRALVTLESDTYAETRRNGEDVYVEQQLVAGDIKELYGTADSTMRAGSWQTTFTLEGDPLRTLGTPPALFRAKRVCWDLIPGDLSCFTELEPEGR